jgi:ABC-type transport system substrate-binding protein
MNGRILTVLGASVLLAGCAEQADDTIVVGLSADITTFEPGMISSRDNANIARHIFGSLFTLTGDGEHVPELAHTLEISDDGTEYVYTLNEGLTCHDGEPLTAEDVAYTFNRIVDPANRFTGNTPGFVFTSIGFEGAEALDDLTVRIDIARKNPIAFGLMTEVYIHCKDAYEAMTLDEAASNPIGSGSYRLASWTRGSEVVPKRSETRATSSGSSGGSSRRRRPGRRSSSPGTRTSSPTSSRSRSRPSTVPGEPRCGSSRAPDGCTWASTSRTNTPGCPVATRSRTPG